ncbi:MAG: bifunctional DNA primase/polymerase [Rickettsiales bacterium]|nr:bifunctional DNA primase/polymerase [Rickettsiales bacterium]
MDLDNRPFFPSDCTTCQEAALEYVRRGFRVAPLFSPLMFSRTGATRLRGRVISSTCKVRLSWRHFLQPLASEAEVRSWWAKYPLANVMVMTGKQTGIVVLDVDDVPEMEGTLAKLNLPATLRASSGGRGEHWYFRHPGNVTLPTIHNGIEGVFTLIADGGGGVAAAPSLHASGVPYQWINPEQPMAALPLVLLNAVAGKRGEPWLRMLYYFYVRPRVRVLWPAKVLFWWQDKTSACGGAC